MVMVLLPALECFKESIKHVETGRPLAGLQKHPLQARPAGKRGLGEAGGLRPWGKRRRHGGKRVIGSQAACPARVILSSCPFHTHARWATKMSSLLIALGRGESSFLLQNPRDIVTLLP